MKRLYTFGIALLTLTVLAGCNDIKEFAESSGMAIVLTATHEGVSPDTKTLRMDDGSTWWNPKEEISVFYGSGSNGGNKFTSKNTTIAETTEFEGSISSMSGSREFWAVYPYSTENSCDGNSITTVIPSEQTGVEGNFSDDAFPAMGKSSSLTMPFYNICGGVKFYVSRADIKSVTFKGNNGEALAGKVKVVFGVDGKPEVAEVLDGKTEVTLMAPDGETFKAGKYYYMTLLPAELEGGFTITLRTASDAGSVVSRNARSIKRSTFGVLKNIDSSITEWNPSVPVPDVVDLGLSVKWASFNLGATKPEEYGNYYAWGETEPKGNYSWSTYKWCNGDYNKLTKYCTNSSHWDSSDPMDYKTILDLEDDAATANWGSNWRMPTDAEWTELKENCTWTWTSDYNGTGIAGRVVTSNKTGYTDKSLFLPAAGRRQDDKLYRSGSYGHYWSSSFNTDYPKAWGVYFHSGNVVRGSDGRYYGFSVRPVYGPFIHVESITLDNSTLELIVGESAKLNFTISPSNATEPSVRWASGDVLIVSVDQKGNITANNKGSTTITAYASNGLNATCAVTVMNNLSKPDSVEAVDLGLPSGLKWATCNVGASNPEDYGDYFAWSETEPKSDYSWSTYKRSNGDYNKLTKYCTQSSYWDSSEPMDNKSVLDPEDDAASANWGGSWRMPTDEEWTELRSNCTWKWTAQNGVNGRVVTGPNGNSIFLPAAGSRYFTGLLDGSCGYYWSSSLYTDYPVDACSVGFKSDNVSRDFYDRSFGFSVRPVYGKFIPVESLTLNKTSLKLSIKDTYKLTASVDPSNATAKDVHWETSDKSVATVVFHDGLVTAVAPGTVTITAYGSSGVRAACVVSVIDLSRPASVEAVDLGLSSGLKWASMNVGATKPEEYGEYFAWGETQPKTDYSWATYKYWLSGAGAPEYNIIINKYCDYYETSHWGGSGSPDNKRVLDLDDDAASVNWGGNWRMPTDREWYELLSECSWTASTSQNGVKGRLITGPNGNSIFLPAAGCWLGSDHNYTGTSGLYWSSTGGSPPWEASYVSSGSVIIDRYSRDRCGGLSVRPVLPKD